jgi:putative membrane protein
MIENYPDHSANERTYLAWVRTAISIVGFGIVVSKLGDVKAGGDGTTRTGLALLILGMVLILAASVRFLLIRKAIQARNVTTTAPLALDLALALVLALMIATLAGFSIHIVSL